MGSTLQTSEYCSKETTYYKNKEEVMEYAKFLTKTTTEAKENH